MNFDGLRMTRSVCAVGLLCLTAAMVVDGAAPAASPGLEYFVAPDGSRANDGSAQRPLDLATALSSASPARPGDTIWLRAGTYRGAYRSALVGTATAPIIVRQYPGERATIDSGSTGADALTVGGAYTWFWGFEITSSDAKRISAERGSWPYDLRRGYGGVTHAPGIKFINLVVHDNANGLGLWLGAHGSEAYGNLIYHNGWQGPDRAHGHGIYTQNQTPTRRIAENIIFNQFSHGIHAYGSDTAWLDNITVEGNIAFMNGSTSLGGIYESGREILLGGWRVAANAVVDSNFTYKGQSNIGYGAGCSNGRVANNYFAGALILVKCDALTSSNYVYDENWPRYGAWPTQFPGNTFYSKRPKGTVIRVRPNAYEPGRSHVVIYNWDERSDVDVSLKGTGLAIGAAYEIRDAQNFFDGVVASGIYDGGVVNLPLTGLTGVMPVGNVPRVPAHTAPELAVFIVVPTDGVTDPPVESAPAPTAHVSLSTSSVVSGNSATLSWSSTGASTVSVSPNISSAAVGSATVSPLATTTYVVTATNSDGESVSDNVTLTVTPRPPTAPTLRIDSPAATASLVAPATVAIDASAVDPSASITRVRFFANGSLVGEDVSAPYHVSWSGAGSGLYVLTAEALGAIGVVASAPGVTIRVNPAVSAPPSTPSDPPTPPDTSSTPNNPSVNVQLTAPREGEVFVNQGTIGLTAAVSNPSAVARVEFYRGDSHIGTASSTPYTGKWTFAPTGTYALTARTYLRNGAVQTSAPVTVHVTSLPTVRLITPLAGTYPSAASVVLTAAASDLDGSIARVEFYEGTKLLGQTTSAPFTYTWQGVGEGTYLVTARAYDNLGLATTSATVSVTLNAPPSVTLISPTPGGDYRNQGTVTLEAAAADPNGSIRKVEFYRGNSLVGTAWSSPHRFNWTYVATGSYVLRARAYDDKGTASWSAPVAITVQK